MKSDLEPVLAAAGRQSGVIARRQATRWISVSAVKWLLTTGQWQRIHPGVYGVHRGPLTWWMRAHAAVLSAGPGAALGGLSAAFVHGIVTRQPQVIEVVIPHARRVKRVPGMRTTRRRIMHIEQVRGLSVISAEDAVLDCCASPLLGWRDIVGLIADAVSRRATSAAALTDALRARRRRADRRSEAGSPHVPHRPDHDPGGVGRRRSGTLRARPGPVRDVSVPWLPGPDLTVWAILRRSPSAAARGVSDPQPEIGEHRGHPHDPPFPTDPQASSPAALSVREEMSRRAGVRPSSRQWTRSRGDPRRCTARSAG